MLIGYFAYNNFFIKPKKLADHPVTVGGNPNADGNVMA